MLCARARMRARKPRGRDHAGNLHSHDRDRRRPLLRRPGPRLPRRDGPVPRRQPSLRAPLRRPLFDHRRSGARLHERCQGWLLSGGGENLHRRHNAAVAAGALTGPPLCHSKVADAPEPLWRRSERRDEESRSSKTEIPRFARDDREGGGITQRGSMKTVKELPPLRALVREARARGKSIGLVPTMGALHEGHLSLVRLARKSCGFTVVSIFVNPLQFSPGEDFERYPRREGDDAAVLETAGADVVYIPDAKELYPPDFSTEIEVGGVSEGQEGAARPGHFRGVTTVVAKLFLRVQPAAAFFGRKDLQQVAVIRRMTRDLDFPIRIEVGPTVREPDGLPLSSRNASLAVDERRKASGLPRALFAARSRAAAGNADARELERETREELERAGLAVDYVEVVDPETMRRMDRAAAGTALAAAVRVGKARLIDNVFIPEER